MRLSALVALLLVCPLTLADISGASRADSHAPIGIMGDHLHKSGEWMLGYRYMLTEQSGLLDGTDSVSKEDTYSSVASGGYGYHNAPLDMRMNMHMFEMMYGLSDRLTLMLMANYMDMNMAAELHAHGPVAPIPYEMDISGWGDTQVVALFDLGHREHSRWVGQLGVNLPTGSTTEDHAMPHGAGGTMMSMRMEYNMQLGSGTYDLLPALVYAQDFADWSWGARAGAVWRVGRNDQGYRLGHRAEFTTWASRLWTPALSTSVRLIGSSWGNIQGQDAALHISMSPAADPKAQAGNRIDVGLGVNWAVPAGFLHGHRLSVELVRPVYENLDGPQLSTDITLNFGWQKAF